MRKILVAVLVALSVPIVALVTAFALGIVERDRGYDLVSGGEVKPLGALPHSSQLAYVDSKKLSNEYDDEIRLLSADGSRAMVLEHARHPAWAPDGSRIAFDRPGVSAGVERHDIWVARDGGGVERLTSGIDSTEPAWSPDGRRIAFVGNGDIYVVNADGSALRRVTGGRAEDRAPSWSPDGRLIAFRSLPYDPSHGGAGIWVVRADGSRPRPLTRSASGGTEPDWSPDGRKIAFSGGHRIWVMNADGSNMVRLTRIRFAPAVDDSPDWSPDGRWISFRRWIPGYSLCCGVEGVWVVDARSGSARHVTEGEHGDPSWRPPPRSRS